MKKTFLLDSGILLANPQAIFSFDEHDIALPYATITQLVEKKKVPGETGANARESLRIISEQINRTLPGGGRLFVIPSADYERCHGETPVIQAYFSLMEDNRSSGEVVLVTNNSAVKILANIYSVRVEPFLTEQVAPPLEQYRGRRDIYLPSELISQFMHEKELPADVLPLEESPLVENEFLIIHNSSSPSCTVLGMFKGGAIHAFPANPSPYGITPRKVGQRFAIAALMAPVEEIPLVILKGPAGTAKTFLSLAVGLEMTINQRTYDRILVTRPNIKFDNDIGYLKGTEEEKIGPLIRPVMDNLELLCRGGGPAEGGNYAKYLFDQGIITAQAMAYMRGRSVANTYIIIDEAQNMTPLQAFGIISRVGIGSKVVLAGDPEQIDAPELDRRNNGLSYASEKMRGSKSCAQVTFDPEECVRSELALEAIKRMSAKSISV